MFTVEIPGNVARFIALPKEERRATYKRWWIATKKEANHYWVSLCLSCRSESWFGFLAYAPEGFMSPEKTRVYAILSRSLHVGKTDVVCHPCSLGLSCCLLRLKLPSG